MQSCTGSPLQEMRGGRTQPAGTARLVCRDRLRPRSAAVLPERPLHPELEKAFGRGRTAPSGLALIGSLIMVLTAPFIGSIVDRFGVKVPAALSLVSMALAYFALSMTGSSCGAYPDDLGADVRVRRRVDRRGLHPHGRRTVRPRTRPRARHRDGERRSPLLMAGIRAATGTCTLPQVLGLARRGGLPDGRPAALPAGGARRTLDAECAGHRLLSGVRHDAEHLPPVPGPGRWAEVLGALGSTRATHRASRRRPGRTGIAALRPGIGALDEPWCCAVRHTVVAPPCWTRTA